MILSIFQSCMECGGPTERAISLFDALLSTNNMHHVIYCIYGEEKCQTRLLILLLEIASTSHDRLKALMEILKQNDDNLHALVHAFAEMMVIFFFDYFLHFPAPIG